MKAKFYYLVTLILFVLSTSVAYSSNNEGSVSGQILDIQKQPVAFSTVALLNSTTKQIEKGAVSDEKGKFSIQNVQSGEYILSVRMVGYATNETEKIIVNAKNSHIQKNIELNETTQQLQEIVITDKTKFVEQAVDKVIINPNASITSASKSVFEILKKSPGIIVDNDDNITIKGMQGVVVMIDDKPTHMTGKELAPLLKGMIGKNIKNIEIIENPSACYDAQGNSGIINIKTKHSKAPGFNGNFNSGLSYSPSLSGNAGLDLNMNYGKVNIYGSILYSKWESKNGIVIKRKFIGDNQNDSYQLNESETNGKGNYYNYKLGADYYMSKNHVLSFMTKGNIWKNNNDNNGNSSFADNYMNVDSMMHTISLEKYAWSNRTFNVNYKWDIDSTGRSLIADVDYARMFFNSNSNQDNKYYNANGQEINRMMQLKSEQDNNIDIVSAKLDYSHPLYKTLFFESGLKYSLVSTNSNASMLGYITQNDEFAYNENIAAAYVSGRATLNKTTLQLGLRLENTSSTGNSIRINQRNNYNYLHLFPSVFLQQNINPTHSAGFRYSYRIGRPNYHALNPFKWMLNPYVYNLGNPFLTPEFTHSVSLNHNFKSMLITNIGLNYTKDLFTQVIYQNNDTKTAWQTEENLGNSLYFNLTETIQLQPSKWWQLNGTFTGMYKEVNAKLPLGTQFKRWSLMANMSNNFNLPFGVGMELSGKYMSKQLIGNFTMKPNFAIDLGFKRNVLKDKGVVQVSLTDIFNTSVVGAYTQYANVDIDVNNHFETRQLKVSFNYRFGKSEFVTRAGRSTASSEEEGRSSK